MESNSTTSANETLEDSGSSKIALIIGMVNLVVGVVAVIGNSLLCLTIYRDPYRRLRNTASYLVVNLAVADLLTGLITEPLYAAFEISNFMGKEVDVLYVIGESTAYVFVNTSILSILLMAWDRYIAVKYPFLHEQKMGCKRIFTMIILLWFYSIVFSTLRFMGVPQDVFYWVDLHVNYTLFGGLLIGLYVSIYFTIKHQMEQSLRIQGYNSQIRRQLTHDKIKAMVKSEKKMTKTVFLLVLVAIACMLPLYIMLHVELLCESCMEVSVVQTISKLSEPILFLNSGLNPFLYAWTIPKYRQALKEILPLTRCLQTKIRRKERETSTGAKKPSSAFCIHNHQEIYMVDRQTTSSSSKESSKNPTVELINLRNKNSV